MAEEAGANGVFARGVDSFSGLAIFSWLRIVGVVHAVYVAHGPLYAFGGILPVETTYEGFHAASGGADEYECGAQIGVVE